MTDRGEIEKSGMTYAAALANAFDDGMRSVQTLKPPAESLQEQCKEVVDDWRAYWMNQTQNSKEDYDNYFRRAMGVDANMGHHLARKFAEFVAARAQESEKVERLIRAAKAVGKQCANTGMYGPLGIGPGECKCANCELRSALREFESRGGAPA